MYTLLKRGSGQNFQLSGKLKKVIIIYIFVMLQGCYPDLRWDSPCDKNNSSYSKENCLEWVKANPDVDFDNDGFSYSQGDCDETRSDVNPSKEEIPFDDEGADENCNGIINEGYDAFNPITQLGEKTDYSIFYPRNSTAPLMVITSSSKRILIIDLSDGSVKKEKYTGDNTGLLPITYPYNSSITIYTAGSEKLYAYDEDLNNLWEHSITENILILSITPVNESGGFKIASAINISNYEGNIYGYVYLTDPLSLTSTVFWAGSKITSELKSADINGDGEDEILVGKNDGTLSIYNSNGNLYKEVKLSENYEIIASPIAEDLDEDGEKEICVGSTSWSFYCLDKNLNLIFAFPTGYEITGEAIPVDIDGDGIKEIVVPSGDKNLYIISLDGSELFSYSGDNSFSTAPVAGEIYPENEGPEIVAGDDGGILYVLSGRDETLLWKKKLSDSPIKKLGLFKAGQSKIIGVFSSDGEFRFLYPGIYK